MIFLSCHTLLPVKTHLHWIRLENEELKKQITTFGRLATSLVETSRDFLFFRPDQGCYTWIVPIECLQPLPTLRTFAWQLSLWNFGFGTCA